jgi:acetyl esterase/lipase
MSTCQHLVLLILGLLVSLVAAEPVPPTSSTGEPKILSGLAYKAGELTTLERERCVLDLYLPEGKDFPTLVWFHGGGLIEGRWDGALTRNLAKAYARAGVAVASVGYRLSPTVKFPAYIEDSAAAFAWVHQHIAEQGGNPRTVFLSGHSAGGYLAMMVGLDRSYLQKHALTADAIAGIIPVAGQTVTHYAVRDERGLPREQLVVDAAAPLHHVRKDTPPILLLVAEQDMASRVEENQLLLANFKAAGNKNVGWFLAAGRTHGTIAEWMAKPDDPVAAEVLAFVRRIAAERVAAKP